MIEIAQAAANTKALPEEVFNIWSDVSNWNQWDEGIEWAKLQGTFAAGNKYLLKPKGGPKAKALITSLVQNESFEDETKLPGAKLRFKHKVTNADGVTIIKHEVTMEGILAKLWVRIMGKNLRQGLQPAVDKLAKLAEQK
jgi:hypothetical protein